MKHSLPINYDELSAKQRKEVRQQYVTQQNGKCAYCKGDLDRQPSLEIKCVPINWNLFPPGFLRNPIHLQHNHETGMTEGAVHAYCNAVLWYHHGK